MDKINIDSDIYDCNAWFGVNYLNNELSVNKKDLEHYLNYFKRNKKRPKVFLNHYFSLFYDPMDGDGILEKIIKENESFYGVLIFPNYFISREKDFEKYLIDKFQSGFKIIRLYPKTHKYSINYWAFDSIYSILDKFRFPIMINLEEIDITGNKAIDWKIFIEISNNYPNIPLIIDGGESKELMYKNYFYQLLKKSKNIYLETHNLLAFNQIEDITYNFGSLGLIYGSYFPYFSKQLSFERVKYSRISDNDKLNILSNNIKGIIERIEI